MIDSFILSVSIYIKSSLMAVRFLDEKLHALSKMGCLLTVSGSIIIVIHAPKESEVNSLVDFARKIGASRTIFTKISKHKLIDCFVFVFRIYFIFIDYIYHNYMFNSILCSTFRIKICSCIYSNLLPFGCFYSYSM